MLNITRHAALVALAGPDFAWPAKGGNRPTAKAREPFRVWLANRQGGLCAVCGNGIRNGEFNHVISRGANVKGFVVGNIFVGCAECNTRCEREFGAVIPLNAFKRADLIVSDYFPRMTDLARGNV